MKRIITLLIVVVLSIPGLAQKSSGLFEQLTEKYAETDGFSASQISSEMFDLYLKKRNVEEESPVFDALKKLDNILVVSQSSFNGTYFRVREYSVESSKSPKAEKDQKNETEVIHKEILNYYKTNNFSLLKTEKRMGEDVKVYLKRNQNKVESLALITSSSVSTNLVELRGDIDLKTVAQLGQALNLRGLENLYKIDDSNQRYLGYRRILPEEQAEEMFLRQRELAERHAELTDEQRIKMEQQAQIQVQKQLELAEKYRQMSETYGRQPIFLSYPGDTNAVYYLDGKKVKAQKIKEINKDKIESIEYSKPDKEGDKTTIKITTKK